MIDKEERRQEIRHAIEQVVKSGEKVTNNNVLNKLLFPCSFSDISPVLKEWKNNAYKNYACSLENSEYFDSNQISIDWKNTNIPFWIFDEYQISRENLESLLKDIERFGLISFKNNSAAN